MAGSDMKPYRDVFGNQLTKKDIALAVQTIVQTRRATSSLLQRRLRWGYGKILKMYELFEDAGFVGPIRSDATRTIILKDQDQAINAVFRQLKKGRKGEN